MVNEHSSNLNIFVTSFLAITGYVIATDLNSILARENVCHKFIFEKSKFILKYNCLYAPYNIDF